MIKIKTLTENELIEKLFEFSEKAGIHLSENMQQIAKFLQEQQGNIYVEVLEAAFSRFLKGIINIKAPYRINNRFISELINAYFEIQRAKHQYIEDDESKIEKKLIDEIIESGNNFTLKQYKDTFYNKNLRLTSSFFLANKYSWLLEKKRFELSWFDEASVKNKIESLKNWEVGILSKRNIKVKLPKIDYKKAAYVALYYDYLIINLEK